MKKTLNYFLLSVVAALVVFSLLFFASLSAAPSLQRFGNTTYYFSHQLYAFIAAIIAGIIAYKIPLSWYKKFAFPLVIVNLIFLFLVFMPKIGSKIAGASRWVSIGGYGFQPSEFLKLTSILYLAAWIAAKLAESHSSDWKHQVKKGYHNVIYLLVPFLIFLGIITVALSLQKDASTLGIITLTLLALYFSGDTPIWHTLCIILLGVVFLFFLIKFEPYRLDRWLIFLHPNQDPLGKAYQLKQSLIALGSGGIFGKGLGMSSQKFGALPQVMSDSIFAIVGEELGIVGCIILIAVFIIFLYAGLKIAKQSNDRFAKTVAIGIVVWITLQAFVNIASVAGVFPLAGIPLPFFSYGGSHLVVEVMGVGVLLNISKNT